MRTPFCVFLAGFGLLSSIYAHRAAPTRTQDELATCLRASLSPQGAVILPADPDFTNDTKRFSAYDAPNFRVISEVANEEDVRASINCAKQTNTTFLFAGPRHGFYTGFSKIQNDLEIYTNEGFANTIDIDAAANTVTVGGAVNFKTIESALYYANKSITVGSGPCFGIVGASLGAGLGRLQGLYGFTSDNILSVNLMLANTTVLTVSNTSHPDLFWGIRGAGFNFGFILNATYQVYEEENEGNSFSADFEWPLNMTEKFYQALKDEDLPAPLCVTTLLGWNETLNATTLIVNANYAGPASEGRAAVQFLVDVGNAIRTNFTASVPWNRLTENTYFFDGNTAILSCDFPVARRQIFGAALNEIDPASNANMSYQFDSVMRQYPQMRTSDNTAYYCSQKGVLERPDNYTAFPWRKAVGHQTWGWVYGDNTTDATTIDNAPYKIRQTIVDGARTNGLETYVGFSDGDETPEQIWGSNVPNLVGLKRHFDPEGWFNAYHPLPTVYP